MVDIKKVVQSQHCRDKEDDDIPSKTMLLRNEVINGIITGDILEVILKTATARERKEVMALIVWTAAGYRKPDRHDDLMSWAEVVVADKGMLLNTGNGTEDTRTRAWLAVPLEGFVGRALYHEIHAAAT